MQHPVHGGLQSLQEWHTPGARQYRVLRGVHAVLLLQPTIDRHSVEEQRHESVQGDEAGSQPGLWKLRGDRAVAKQPRPHSGVITESSAALDDEGHKFRECRTHSTDLVQIWGTLHNDSIEDKACASWQGAHLAARNFQCESDSRKSRGRRRASRGW